MTGSSRGTKQQEQLVSKCRGMQSCLSHILHACSVFLYSVFFCTILNEHHSNNFLYTLKLKTNCIHLNDHSQPVGQRTRLIYDILMWFQLISLLYGSLWSGFSFKQFCQSGLVITLHLCVWLSALYQNYLIQTVITYFGLDISLVCVCSVSDLA